MEYSVNKDHIISDKGEQGNVYRDSNNSNLVIKVSKRKDSYEGKRDMCREYAFMKHCFENNVKVSKPMGVFNIFNEDTRGHNPGYVMQKWGSENVMTLKEMLEKDHYRDSKKGIDVFNKALVLKTEQRKLIEKIGFNPVDIWYLGNALWCPDLEDICIIDACKWEYNGEDEDLFKWNF
jgi:hypothetical protein